MKFPLAQPPFTLPLQLSPTQCIEYQHLAETLVAKTVAEYETFCHSSGHTVELTQWKAVKTRERVTLYKRRRGEKAQSPTGRLPELMAVGTLDGTLDDAMYGEMTPDADSFKIKSAYIHDELVDGRVLHQFQYATEEDPFRFVGLKWFVKAHPSSFSAVVKPRDLVVLDSMGVHVLTNGERIGYHLMHSVDVGQQCPELKHLGLVRCKLSVCYIYHQVRKQTVEVFMTASVDPCSSAPESVAIKSTANGLISCAKVTWCAENRKLAWLANEAARLRIESQVAQQTTEAKDKGNCGVCTKSTSAFRVGGACELCFRPVCSKCRSTRKLSTVQTPAPNGCGAGDLVRHAVVFCVDCVQRCKRVSSAEIARFEHVPGALARKQLLRQRSGDPEESIQRIQTTS